VGTSKRDKLLKSACFEVRVIRTLLCLLRTLKIMILKYNITVIIGKVPLMFCLGTNIIGRYGMQNDVSQVFIQSMNYLNRDGTSINTLNIDIVQYYTTYL